MKKIQNKKRQNQVASVNSDFWSLLSVGSIAVLSGIVVDPSSQTNSGKFLLGVAMGIGMACILIGFIVLIRGPKNLNE